MACKWHSWWKMGISDGSLQISRAAISSSSSSRTGARTRALRPSSRAVRTRSSYRSRVEAIRSSSSKAAISSRAGISNRVAISSRLRTVRPRASTASSRSSRMAR